LVFFLFSCIYLDVWERSYSPLSRQSHSFLLLLSPFLYIHLHKCYMNKSNLHIYKNKTSFISTWLFQSLSFNKTLLIMIFDWINICFHFNKKFNFLKKNPSPKGLMRSSMYKFVDQLNAHVWGVVKTLCPRFDASNKRVWTISLMLAAYEFFLKATLFSNKTIVKR